MEEKHKRTIINGPKGKALAKVRIDMLPDNETIDMRLKPYRKDRTRAQQALGYIWAAQWADHYGISKDQAYIEFKALFLLPLLLEKQEPEGIIYLHKCAQDVLEYEGDMAPMQALHRFISTNGLNVKENADILTQYQRWAAERDFHFTTKNEWYDEAMRWSK